MSEKLMIIFVGILIVTPLVAGIYRNYPQYSEKLYSQGEVEQVADFLQDYLKRRRCGGSHFP